MSGRGKEQDKLSEGRREDLKGILSQSLDLLHNNIDDFPEGIVSGDKILVGGVFKIADKRYKCKVNWLQGVIDVTVRIIRVFPSDEGLRTSCKAYESLIVNRRKLFTKEDPRFFIDATGRSHILTIRKEIDEANNILKIIIEKLKSELGE